MMIRRLAVSAALGAGLLAGAGAAPAQGRLPTVRPPDAIDRAQGMATRPIPGAPPPPPVEERWVPERRLWSQDLGTTIVVPGHYERRITDQRYRVPPLTGFTDPGGRAIPIPSGEYPPADSRNAP